LIAAQGIGLSTAVDVSVFLSLLIQYGVTTGAAGSEIDPNLALTNESVSFGAVVSGLGAGGSVVVASMCGGDVPIGPLLVPAQTRIALRASTSGAPSIKNIGVYLSGYDQSALTWNPKLGADELLELGSRPTYSQPLVPVGTAMPVVVTGSPAGNWGSYTPILDPLDGDYLLEAAVAIPTDAICRSTQFDVACGPTGGGGEVIQARFCAPQYVLVSAYAFSCRMRWPYRFIGYKGERVSVRGIAPSTAARSFAVNIYGTRLN
jgi:hypothetical protein